MENDGVGMESQVAQDRSPYPKVAHNPLGAAQNYRPLAFWGKSRYVGNRYQGRQGHGMKRSLQGFWGPCRVS